MCSNLFKAHILTGSDTTSKIGTKAAAIKCGQNLNNFGLEYYIKSQFENAQKSEIINQKTLTNSMNNTLIKASH